MLSSPAGKYANTKHFPLSWIYFCYMHEIMKHWMNHSTVDAGTHKLVKPNISQISTLNKCFLHLWKKFKKQWSRNEENKMYTETTIIISYYKAYMFIPYLFLVFTTWSSCFLPFLYGTFYSSKTTVYGLKLNQNSAAKFKNLQEIKKI